MTKQELAQYAGNQVYAQVRRMGGCHRDIDCITVYEITERGTLRYVSEVYSCVANKRQRAAVDALYPNRVFGRPVAEIISRDQIEALVN